VVPDLDLVQRAVGIRADRTEHGRWVAAARELADTLPRLLRPRAVYRIDAVRTIEPAQLVLASGTTFHGDIAGILSDACYVASAVVTIGPALERLARRWIRGGEAVRGSLADAFASEAVEAAADRLQAHVRAWAQARGLDITPRYSPGYCGLDLHQQMPLFAGLPTERIRVRLQPSCLMLPLKSISCLIGIGPADRVHPDVVPCQLCDHPDCMQRRAEFRRQK